MDAVAFSLPPNAPVAPLEVRGGGGQGLATSTGRHASIGAAVPLCAGSPDRTAEEPQNRALPPVRCGGCCGGGAAASSLAVYAFLVVVNVVAAAWNARMALINALQAQQLIEEMAAGCSGSLGGGLSSVANRRAHAADGRAHGVCMIDADELLREASQVRRDAISTKASGAIQLPLAFTEAPQPNGLKGKARALAHLGSASYPEPRPTLLDQRVNRWRNATNHKGSFVVGNISNAGGGVTIGENGYYFVYSQVGYILAAVDADEVSSSTDHKLLRLQAASRGGVGSSEPILLARARKTRCWSSKSNCSITSSYVGAVFRLDKKDVVTVDVDRARYVWYNPKQTYIGAYLLTS